MPRGGRRPGSGPKKKPVLAQAPSLKKDLAQQLLSEPETAQRWKAFRDLGDHWFRLAVEKYIWDRAEGRPIQQVRLANPPGEKFEVNVTSARDKLVAKLLGRTLPSATEE